MKHDHLILELRPRFAGEQTEIVLRGCVETLADPHDLHKLLKALRAWSSKPVEIALCVEGVYANHRWLEAWLQSLNSRPAGAHRQQDLF
jgi:hypothetical protein